MLHTLITVMKELSIYCVIVVAKFPFTALFTAIKKYSSCASSTNKHLPNILKYIIHSTIGSFLMFCSTCRSAFTTFSRSLCPHGLSARHPVHSDLQATTTSYNEEQCMWLFSIECLHCNTWNIKLESKSSMQQKYTHSRCLVFSHASTGISGNKL